MQSHKQELEAAGYNIVGVSKDKVELQKKFADTQGLEFPLIADTDTTLLQQLGCWGEKVACGRKTIGILRTTYLVSEQGIIEKVFQPKEIKTKIHAEQILKWMWETGHMPIVYLWLDDGVHVEVSDVYDRRIKAVIQKGKAIGADARSYTFDEGGDLWPIGSDICIRATCEETGRSDMYGLNFFV